MSLPEEVRTFIPTAYIGDMPAAPDNAVCIYPTGGYPRSMSGTHVEEPTFMVKIRNLSFPAGETVCDSIKDALHGKSTAKILVIAQQGDVNYIGKDESGRPEWTINFRAYYRR